MTYTMMVQMLPLVEAAMTHVPSADLQTVSELLHSSVVTAVPYHWADLKKLFDWVFAIDVHDSRLPPE